MTRKSQSDTEQKPEGTQSADATIDAIEKTIKRYDWEWREMVLVVGQIINAYREAEK